MSTNDLYIQICVYIYIYTYIYIYMIMSKKVACTCPWWFWIHATCIVLPNRKKARQDMLQVSQKKKLYIQKITNPTLEDNNSKNGHTHNSNNIPKQNHLLEKSAPKITHTRNKNMYNSKHFFFQYLSDRKKTWLTNRSVLSQKQHPEKIEK